MVRNHPDRQLCLTNQRQAGGKSDKDSIFIDQVLETEK